MPYMDVALAVYAGFVIFGSFAHLIRLDYWWIRIWDFPHLQLAIMGLIGLAAYLAEGYAGQWGGLWIPVGLVAGLGYQSWLIYPYTPLKPVQVPRFRRIKQEKERVEANSIRILTANVYMYNTHMPEVKSLVKRYEPDILMVLEANNAWKQALDSIEEQYPYRILMPLENTYGMLFYSKLPIRNDELRFLIQEDIPSIYTQVQLPSGVWVNFYGVHPMPPSPTEHYRSTERDAELVLVGREARKKAGAVIVAGDLNDVAWSHTTRLFQRLSGLFDPRIGRGLYSTFHARYFFIRWPLDHIFVSHHFQLLSLKKLPNCGSDHFPILATFMYAPDPARAADRPEPEGDDLEEAQEKVEKAREAED